MQIQNWHFLNWETEEKIAKKKGVDKRGAKSDEAYVREVLGEMANARNLIIINDEAHHAWRIPSEKVKGLKKEEIEESHKMGWRPGQDKQDPRLELEMEKVKTLELDARDTATLAELAPVVEGKPDYSELSEIDLRDLGKKFRMQKIIFETAGEIFDQMKPTWKGSREILLAQLIQLVEKFISSEKIRISPSLFNDDDLKRRILITLNMTRIVQHI